MNLNRRSFLKGFGGALALPLLESHLAAAGAAGKPPTRFLVVGNPLGAHPDFFFPKDFGKNFTISKTLSSLGWLKDRMTILSHTDHGMPSGHGKEVSFLSGVLPSQAGAFPEKNMSLDQMFARHVGTQVRYDSIGATLDESIGMSWTATGIERHPVTDPQKLFDHLFLNLTPQQRAERRALLKRDGSILDTVGSQFASVLKNASATDRGRIEQFQTSVRELESAFANRETWLDRDKPSFDISGHFAEHEVTITNRYDAIFDMVAYAFQTDLTRVASVEFPRELSYTDVEGVTRTYHNTTHNGKREDITAEEVAIESFQIARLARCLKKLDSIKEPNGNGTLLDNTIVLFGAGMGYGGTHSNRNLPVFVAGGGFQHLGHVDVASNNGNSMPLCNLYVTLMQRFGIERDKFNLSTGKFDLKHA